MLTVRITLDNNDDNEVDVTEVAYVSLPPRSGADARSFDEDGLKRVVQAAVPRVLAAARA